MAAGAIGHIANVAKGYAIAIGVAVGIWVYWRWATRYWYRLRTDRDAQAARAFAAYLQRAVEWPDLAVPKKTSAGNKAAQRRYENFVAFLLETAEEILLISPVEKWEGLLKPHLAEHKAYLSSASFRNGPAKRYGPELLGLIEDVTGKKTPGQ